MSCVRTYGKLARSHSLTRHSPLLSPCLTGRGPHSGTPLTRPTSIVAAMDSDSDLDLGSGGGMKPSPSALVCVGTREVTMGTADRSKAPVPSILACFRAKESANANGGGDDTKASPSALTLMFTDGVRTYSGRIEKRNLKSTSANTENLQSLLLDESNASITISFGLIDIGDANSPPKVKITVRERLDSGIVKVVWNDFMESGPAANNNAYRFTSFLTSSLRDANKDIAELRAELAKAKADMTGWKDTASKLDGILQKEKDGLTERFLVLYNRVKQDLRNAKKELSEEKKKKTVRVEPMVQNALAPEEPMAQQNNDDQEELMWDANMVEMMAAGPAKKKPSAAAKSRPTGATAAKQPTKRTREEEASTAKKAARHNGGDSPSKKHTSRGAKDSDSDEDEDDDLGASQSQARPNPYSGATEMWGPGGIFAESQGGENDDFETFRKKREAQRKAKSKSSTGTSNTSGADANGSNDKDLSEMANSADKNKSPDGSGAKTIDLAGDGSSSEDSF